MNGSDRREGICPIGSSSPPASTGSSGPSANSFLAVMGFMKASWSSGAS